MLKKTIKNNNKKQLKYEDSDDDVCVNIDIFKKDEIILFPNTETVNRIVHISDVHISNNLSRYKEYTDVFDRLFDDLKKRKISNDDIIVLTGDIIDQADNISPECIQLTKYFFVGLTNLTTVIFILGNHETHLYDENRVDSLTPIVTNNFSTKNPVHALLKNSCYLYKNINFVHTTIHSRVVTKFVNDDKYISIALYHGQIHGCSSDNNYVMKGRFSMKDFKGFDWCLFGDIHKHQFLNKNKTAWYPGSTIQKTRSESQTKGYVLLDLRTKTPEFCAIKNEHASYNIIMDKNGKINYDIDDLAKFCDIQITIESTNKNHIENLQKNILKKGINITNFIERYDMSKENQIDTTIKIKNKSEILTNVNSDKQLIKIIVDYIKENQELEKCKISDIEFKLVDILQNISTSVESLKNKNIILEELEFSNVLVFGEHNKIEFKNGSYYLSEPNSSGKSCLIDILSIALHSKSPRAVTRGDLIRHNQLTASTKIKLHVNGVAYTITREFKRKTIHSHPSESIIFEKDSKVLFDLEEKSGKNKKKINVADVADSANNANSDDEDEDEDCVNINKKETRDRDKIKNMIDKEIISYDDLFLCSIVSQTKKINFLTEDDKRDLILRYSGLSIFSDISQYSAKKCGELTRQLGILYNDKCFDNFRSKTQKRTKSDTVSFKDTDMENIKKLFEKDKIDHDKKKETTDNEYVRLETNYTKLYEKFIRAEESLKVFDNMSITSKNVYNVDNVDKIIETNSGLETEMSNIKKNILNLKKSQGVVENKIAKFTKQIEKHNDDDIETNQINFELEKKSKLKNLTTQINKLNQSILSTSITKSGVTKKQLKVIENELVLLETNCGNTLDEIKETELLIEIANSDDDIIKNYKVYAMLNCDIEILEYKLGLYENISGNISGNLSGNINGKFDDKKQAGIIKNIKTEIKSKKEELTLISHYKVKYDKYKIIGSTKKLTTRLSELKKILSGQQKNIDEKSKQKVDYQNYLLNIKTIESIEKLENELEELSKTKLEEYQDYLQIKENLNVQQLELNKLLLNIEKQCNQVNLIQKKVEQNDVFIKEYDKNFEQIVKYKKAKQLYDNIKKEHVLLLNEFEKKKKQKELFDVDDKQYFANYKIAQTNYEKYIIVKNDKDSYSVINNLLMKNGLIDSILKNKVLVKLEQTTNMILKSIDHKPISIKMIDKKGNKYKANEVVITNFDGTITGNCGYFERNVMELAIRMAMSQINNFVKINAVFVDECFDGASKENYNKIIKLIEHFKDYYPFNLVISHDAKLVTLFDKRIKIVKPIVENEIQTKGVKLVM